MSVFSAQDFDEHEQVVFAADPATGLRAIIAIHDTSRGPALGGCRMWNYESEEEAIRDALRLSRGMTYKAAIANLPLGGGKAVIIGDPRTGKTPELLRAMGRAVENLKGRYIIAEDVGTTVGDMAEIRTETGHVVGLPAEHGGTGDPSSSTALGVLMGIQAAVDYRRRKDGPPGGLADVRVAVQGVGNVGYHLCRLLAAEGARLTVTDIRAENVRRVVDAFGATAVNAHEIFDADVDVFAPCALGAVIDDDTVPRLNASIVAGSANNQLAEPRHGDALRRRGLLYAPDYVINAGGVIQVAGEHQAQGRDKAARKIKGLYDTVIDIFERADQQKISTGLAADRIAEERFRPHRPASLAAQPRGPADRPHRPHEIGRRPGAGLAVSAL